MAGRPLLTFGDIENGREYVAWRRFRSSAPPPDSNMIVDRGTVFEGRSPHVLFQPWNYVDIDVAEEDWPVEEDHGVAWQFDAA